MRITIHDHARGTRRVVDVTPEEIFAKTRNTGAKIVKLIKPDGSASYQEFPTEREARAHVDALRVQGYGSGAVSLVKTRDDCGCGGSCGCGGKTRDAYPGEVSWINVRQEIYGKLEVGKIYKMGEHRFKVLQKEETSGQKSAAGLMMGGPMIRVRYLEPQKS